MREAGFVELSVNTKNLLLIFTQMFGGEHLRSSGHGQFESTSSSCTRSLSMDMHMELLAFQHRISLKLLDIYPGMPHHAIPPS